eukprot:COSAG02_NODE_77245_length_127_cov_35.107143_1_plen_34_part_01
MVALKFIANKEEWLRDQEMGKEEGDKLEARHVA